jgi:hypothetical protein
MVDLVQYNIFYSYSLCPTFKIRLLGWLTRSSHSYPLNSGAIVASVKLIQELGDDERQPQQLVA